jgi:polyhydroxyalkanoate synthesis regulator phasin
MNIDIIVAKLVKKGMSKSNASKFANDIIKQAKLYNIPVSEMFEDISKAELSKMGDFLTNTVNIKGYRTGKVEQRTASDIVNRTIIK